MRSFVEKMLRLVTRISDENKTGSEKMLRPVPKTDQNTLVRLTKTMHANKNTVYQQKQLLSVPSPVHG